MLPSTCTSKTPSSLAAFKTTVQFWLDVTTFELEPLMAELMDEFDASLVRLDPFVFDDLVDQIVLAVPEAIHCFGLRRVVRTSLGELYTARCEKVANAVVAGLAIHIEPIVCGDIEGTKRRAPLGGTLLKVLVEHLLPACRVNAGGVGDHTVEVEQDGVVLVSGDRTLALGQRHRLLSICSAHSVVLPVPTCLSIIAR